MVSQLSPEDRRKLDELRRVKLLATLTLAGCFLTLLFAKMLEIRYPWIAVLTAFAEAAAIGGIADWYAVVALFRRPLGLPIPHTAIIPRNQDRIAENLGAFIETNFLAPKPVEEKLRQLDFAAEMIKWLADRGRSAGLAAFIARLAPKMLEAVEETGLKDFAADRVATQLKSTNLSPLVMEVLASLTRDDRQDRLLNEVMSALTRFLNDEEAVDAIREKVAEELPMVLNIFRADAMILRRIIRTASELMDEVRDDPDHPLRDEFRQFFRNYVRRMKRSKKFARRIEAMKTQVLDRPELNDIANQMWSTLRAFVEEDAARGEDGVLVARLTDLFMDVARNLEKEPKLRADVNEGMVTAIGGFVAAQRSSIAGFVSDQVKSWDFEQLTQLIEANVGRDLQFIRFNGMIVGGLVGVALFVIEAIILSI